MISPDFRDTLENAVLCWLATADEQGAPNVSPKEVFALSPQQTVLVAHVASPKTVANLARNPKVCLGFLDIFRQKGHKLAGRAVFVDETDPRFPELAPPLLDQLGDRFRLRGVIEVTPERITPILAPSYRFFPDTDEDQQIENALRAYGVTRR